MAGRARCGRDRGFVVLAYGTVADLLGDVDPDVLASLPEVQRVAWTGSCFGIRPTGR